MSLRTGRWSVASEKPGKAVKKNWELDSEKAWFHGERKGPTASSPKVWQENTFEKILDFLSTSQVFALEMRYVNDYCMN